MIKVDISNVWGQISLPDLLALEQLYLQDASIEEIDAAEDAIEELSDYIVDQCSIAGQCLQESFKTVHNPILLYILIHYNTFWTHMQSTFESDDCSTEFSLLCRLH